MDDSFTKENSIFFYQGSGIFWVHKKIYFLPNLKRTILNFKTVTLRTKSKNSNPSTKQLPLRIWEEQTPLTK